ncbi:choline BCCT transporter BetT [Kocuria rhizophila]|uniref:Choline transporter n=1 Tax=Kocuria rhizophila (strain ATCC 9341 / DSM 348 / NBRC 103217 / DC2201) TaxID=378753 RepID=B2GM43_KOCRD|nr:choline BCCT transporter BetT [Kocuria rhizophila]ASE12067.1 high-affinity choline transporter BetT [Kocuria rhizophila]MDV5999711.1 choline BCCT transporter BetT [Kocuria rhizophila]BAG30159.1 choline transporter [Kocuria rhizophila DC2201]VEH74573.1 Glycine betaine transporter BetP [Kocuria rhizophila]
MSESSTPPTPTAEPSAAGSSSADAAAKARLPVNWRVLIAAATVIVVLSAWAITAPEQADAVIGGVVGWVASRLGWFYILTATLVIAFVVMVAASRGGKVRMGPDHARPQFNMFTWTAMLFAAGIGVDLMFFSVSEPVSQYFAPPTGDGQNLEAARQAVVWTLFHYGITGWAMYALMGMAFGYFAYRFGMPLSIRSALYPLLGRRIHGVAGDAVDTAALLGTVFGVATSLGIGVVQLNYGLKSLFGLPENLAVQSALIVVGVGMAVVSCVSGVDKGIRRLSELNIVLAIGLMLYVLVAGRTSFLLDAIVMNVGDFISSFPGMTLNTFAFEAPQEWMSAWTLFFWAWWIAWAPFVGLFLARISRGRTLRQFVVGTMTVPFAFILLWISIFGNSALDLVVGGNTEFGEVAMNTPERAFYSLLEQYPGATVAASIATFTGLLFYVTSADSGALVMSNFTSRIEDPNQDGPKWLRVFWALSTGVLTLAMLLVGGVTTLQNATLIMGLPFSVVMYLIMVGLWRALRVEVSTAASGAVAARSAVAGRTGRDTHWRGRLSRLVSYPGPRAAQRYVHEVAEPALNTLASELRDSGVVVSVDTEPVAENPALPQVCLTVDLAPERDFVYRVHPVAFPTPGFGGFRTNPDSDRYYRLEVFTATGSLGYDVLGYTSEQLINDALDCYERHLEFIRLNHDHPGSTQIGLPTAETAARAENSPSKEDTA